MIASDAAPCDLGIFWVQFDDCAVEAHAISDQGSGPGAAEGIEDLGGRVA